MMNDTMEISYERYMKERETLLEHHAGEYVLIHVDDVIGCYPTEREALEAGYAEFGDQPFFVHKIAKHEIELDYFRLLHTAVRSDFLPLNGERAFSESPPMLTQQMDLTERHAGFIRRLIDEGAYSDANEVIRAGLRLLEMEEEAHQVRLERLRAALQEGWDDYEAGRYIALNSEEEIEAYRRSIRERGRQASTHNIRASHPAE